MIITQDAGVPGVGLVIVFVHRSTPGNDEVLFHFLAVGQMAGTGQDGGQQRLGHGDQHDSHRKTVHVRTGQKNRYEHRVGTARNDRGL